MPTCLLSRKLNNNNNNSNNNKGAKLASCSLQKLIRIDAILISTETGKERGARGSVVG
jgi:hypothetical protein